MPSGGGPALALPRPPRWHAAQAGSTSRLSRRQAGRQPEGRPGPEPPRSRFRTREKARTRTRGWAAPGSPAPEELRPDGGARALSSPLSNKPNPNQISVNNVKAGVVNGAGAPGQTPGAGRACESCYSKSRPASPPPQDARPARRTRAGLGAGVHAAREPSPARGRGDTQARCGGRAAAVWCPLPSLVLLKDPSISTLLSVAAQSYQWYSWGPPNMQCRLCASCWTYWKKYGGLKMPTRLDGERPGPNRSNMVSGPHPAPRAPGGRPAVMALCRGGAPPSAEPPRHPSPEQREPQVRHEDAAGLLPAHHQAHAHRPPPVPRDPAPLARRPAPLPAHQQRSHQGRV